MLNIIKGLIAAAVFSVAASSHVLAQKAPDTGGAFTIGGRAVNLAVLPGFCRMDENHPIDRMLLTQVRGATAGKSELLTQMVECKQLEEVRAGNRTMLDDFSQVQVALQAKDMDARGQESELIKSVCAAMKAQGDKMVTDMLPDVKARVAKAAQGLTLGGVSNLGVLAEDKNACYVGLIQNISFGATTRNLLTVYANTIVNGRFLYIYRFAAPAETQSVEKLLSELRAYIDAQVAANGGHGKKS
jgi:hypothetical protein